MPWDQIHEGQSLRGWIREAAEAGSEIREKHNGRQQREEQKMQRQWVKQYMLQWLNSTQNEKLLRRTFS